LEEVIDQLHGRPVYFEGDSLKERESRPKVIPDVVFGGGSRASQVDVDELFFRKLPREGTNVAQEASVIEDEVLIPVFAGEDFAKGEFTHGVGAVQLSKEEAKGDQPIAAGEKDSVVARYEGRFELFFFEGEVEGTDRRKKVIHVKGGQVGVAKGFGEATAEGELDLLMKGFGEGGFT